MASLALAVGVASGAASAAEPSGAVAAARLQVEANPACTSRADLIARVRARSPRVRFTDDGDALEVRAAFVATATGSIVGSVTLASAGAKPSVRRVLGSSCRDAADAVALIIAVTLDPLAAARDRGALKSEASSVGAAREDEPPAVSPDAAKARTAGPAESPRASDDAETAGTPNRNRFAVQVAAQGVLGPAPRAMPGVALYAMIGIDRRDLWSPAVLLGAGHAGRGGIVEEGGTAAFTLDAASFDACPFRLRFGPVDARPCGSVLIGRLSASGSQTRNQATESGRPFWVVGGAVVATADLSDLFELTARLAVGGNLVRDSFVFTPVMFHQVPAVSSIASLGIGMRWR